MARDRHPGAVDVRDTKDPIGLVLASDGRCWASFLTGLKADTTS